MTEIDLHIHTEASQDGELSPREIFRSAKTLGLRAIAFCDHDSVGSVDAGVALSREFGLDFAPAVELTTRFEGFDPHLLGYFVDWRAARLVETLAWVGTKLMEQARARAARMRELGFHIDFDDVLAACGGRNPATAAILQALKANPKNRDNPLLRPYISGDRADSPFYNIYRDYFYPGRPAFVELETLTTPEAIALVHDVGGVAVIAHPGRTPATLVDGLLEAGLDGVEVYCTTHSADDVRHYEGYVREHRLVATAGSDFHGPAVKPDIRLGQLERGDHGMFTTLRELAAGRGDVR
ncbi:MAG TPA: PHP domain-containing protein [Planctomycetota bacterium]|nr:PHP domain-containing protein [Planctomycetota bacterium]